VLSSSGYTNAVPMQRRLFARRHRHTVNPRIHAYIRIHTRASPRTHAPNVKTTGPLPVRPSLSLALPLPLPLPLPLSFSPLPPSLPSLPRFLSFSLLSFSLFSLPASPVGLPHGQRIRKRGYTRWINFIGPLSLSLSLSLARSLARSLAVSSDLRSTDGAMWVLFLSSLPFALFCTPRVHIVPG